MALPVQTQIKTWSLAAVILFVLLWFLGDVVLPFVIGGAVAYFLDPLADRLEAAGFSRAAATVIISLIAVLIFVFAALLVIPLLIQQAVALVDAAPSLVSKLQVWLTDRFPSLIDENSTLRQSLDAIGAKIQERGGAFLQSALSSAMGVINVLVMLVVVPVVAFYMLLDWDRAVAAIDDLLPRDHAPVIRRLASEIDQTLAAFVRGMGTVCLVLGTYYALALWAVGLNFGLVVGVIAGALTFIPYVGALAGGVLSIGLALFQYWGAIEVVGADGTIAFATDWLRIGLVTAIFVVGQFIEGNILTPRLVGESVGLHPVWLLFSLSVFGTLFGFVGMLVGVPVAAAIGVIARYFISRYREGRLYTGLSGRENGEEAGREAGQ